MTVLPSADNREEDAMSASVALLGLFLVVGAVPSSSWTIEDDEVINLLALLVLNELCRPGLLIFGGVATGGAVDDVDVLLLPLYMNAFEFC